MIWLLRDMPVQTRHDAEALGARSGIQKRYEPSTGEAASEPSDYPSKDGSFRAQIAALRLALGQWEAKGEVPPSIVPTLIQFSLSAAQTESLEMAFLTVFCYHFGAEYADRFGHLVEREVKLGVYPLPMKALKAERAMDRFAVREEATDEPVMEDEETAPIANSPAKGRAMVPPPLSPNSMLVRKAKLGLHTILPPSTRDGHWRPFGGLHR